MERHTHACRIEVEDVKGKIPLKCLKPAFPQKAWIAVLKGSRPGYDDILYKLAEITLETVYPR